MIKFNQKIKDIPLICNCFVYSHYRDQTLNESSELLSHIPSLSKFYPLTSLQMFLYVSNKTMFYEETFCVIDCYVAIITLRWYVGETACTCWSRGQIVCRTKHT